MSDPSNVRRTTWREGHHHRLGRRFAGIVRLGVGESLGVTGGAENPVRQRTAHAWAMVPRWPASHGR